MRYHAWVGAGMVLGIVGLAHAQGTMTASSHSESALSRTQVLEDLKQWHAAGMSFVPHPSGYAEAENSPEYQRYLHSRTTQAGAQVPLQTVSSYAAQEGRATDKH